MKSCEMNTSPPILDEIEPCQTCGIFFLTSGNFLRHLGSEEPEIQRVCHELASWNIKFGEGDSFPQYICSVCLVEFHRIFKFQHSVLETQRQLRRLYDIQQGNINKLKIKQEMCESMENKKELKLREQEEADETNCAFIYVDELSDTEYDDSLPLKIERMPVKEEAIDHDSINNREQKMLQTPVEQKTPADSKVGVQCDLCLHVSIDQQKHRQHVLQIHEAKPLKCHICGTQFKPGTTSTRVKYHMKWHRLNKHVKCAQCGFHCASRQILNEHMSAVHTKVACNVCGKLFLPKKLRTHMAEHQIDQNKTDFQCSYCSICFTTKIQQDEHILTAHSKETIHGNSSSALFMNLEQINSKNLTSLQDLNGSPSASSSVNTTSTTIISLSGEEDDSEASNSDEEIDETSNPSTDNIATTGDGVEVESSVDYESEMESETASPALGTRLNFDLMQFTCAQCPQKFSKVEQLMQHAAMHNVKELFTCDLCGKNYKFKFSLNRHLANHRAPL